MSQQATNGPGTEPTDATREGGQRPDRTSLWILLGAVAIAVGIVVFWFSFLRAAPDRAVPAPVQSSRAVVTPTPTPTDPVVSAAPTTTAPTSTASATNRPVSRPTATTRRPTPTATSATPTPNPTPTPTPTPTPSATTDPQIAALVSLNQKADADRSVAIAKGQWVAQLASKWVGITDPRQLAANGTHTFFAADIWAEHSELVSRVSDATVVLRRSTEFGQKKSHDGEPYWTTQVVSPAFASQDEVTAWCASFYPDLSGEDLRNSCLPVKNS